MKKKVMLKRYEFQELSALFESVQAVTISPEDHKADYMLFKFLCGQNFATIFSKCEEIARGLIKIQSENYLAGRYDEFLSATDSYVESNYAKRDADGNVEVDGEGAMILTGKPDLSPLRLEYKDAIESFEKVNKKLKKYLKGKVTVSLEEINLRKIPANLSGSYLNSLKCVLY